MPPTSTRESSELWKSNDPAAWRAALGEYHTRMAALNNPELEKLDRWFHDKLPGLIAARTPKHMSSEELVMLVDWKMTRGKRRPNLLKWAQEHKPETVLKATSAAIAVLTAAGTKKGIVAIENIPSALKPLVDLKGVGPATASAVLAAADDSLPWMSDDIIAVAAPTASSKDAYSEQRYLAVVDAVRAKAAKVGLTAREVERAVYSEAARTKKPKKAPVAGKKRKR